MARRTTNTEAVIFQIDDTLSADVAEAVRLAGPAVTAQSSDDSTSFRESMYVEILKEILETVLQEESHLFSPEELAVFARFNSLTYESQYLLLRLSLRKAGQWLSLTGLDKSYHADLGPHLAPAMHELSGKKPPTPAKPTVSPKASTSKPQPEVIDLTLSDDEDDNRPTRDMTETVQPTLTDATPATAFFAQNDETATLADLFQCLNKDQLKIIANQLGIAKANSKNRAELVESLLDHAASQSTLSGNGGPLKQLQLNFYADKKLRSQSDILRKKIMTLLVACIRVQPEVLDLFRRLQLVFFRATTWSTDLFLPSILSRAKRRNYTSYKYQRTINVFATRERLLDYENALKLEAEIDQLLDGYSFMYQPKSKKAKAHAESISATPRQDAAQRAKELAAEAWPRWDDLVADAEDRGLDENPCLARFHPGYVYTRIMYTGCRALSLLKDHKSEVICLKALLAQRVWRKTKRGGWYERLALLYMQYGKNADLFDQDELERFDDDGERHLNLAREVVLKGLEDPDVDTHLVHRLSLETRLQRLENRLKLAKEDRYEYESKLKNPKTVSFTGTRIYDKVAEEAETPWTGKSVWQAENGNKVSVEELSIEYYAKKGFKAVHSEGRVVTSLFALLFWDVLFSELPGAFETKFQSAPLDMFHDTFFSSRRSLIESRLDRIRTTGGRRIIEEVDARERERMTVCIGMRWDMFSREDLCDIADCLGGPALAVICRILCEDYGGRTSGVPDLLAWNASKKAAKFVEVKGPGDQLRDNQRIWIHCLRNAGVEVELCKVEEKEERRSRSRSKSARTAANSDSDTAEESEPDLADSDEEAIGEVHMSKSTPLRKRSAPSASPAHRSKDIKEVVIPSPPRAKRRRTD